MREIVILFVHLIATLFRQFGPGGVRSVVAESVLVKHQLLIDNRSRQRSPNLRVSDRLIVGLCALLVPQPPEPRSAIILKPPTAFLLGCVLECILLFIQQDTSAGPSLI